jgi:hypothetical protein
MSTDLTGWKTADTITAGVAAPRVKVWVVVPENTKEPKVYISIGSHFMSKFEVKGEMPEKAEIQYAPDGKQVRIAFGAVGKFDVKTMMKGSARFVVTPWAPPLMENRDTETCKIVDQDATSFIFAMPEGWWPEEAKPTYVAPPIQTVEKGALAKQILPVDGGQINMMHWFKVHGYKKVELLVGGRYLVDGKSMTPRDVLDLINQERKRVDLPPLRMDQLT